MVSSAQSSTKPLKQHSKKDFIFKLKNSLICGRENFCISSSVDLKTACPVSELVGENRVVKLSEEARLQCGRSAQFLAAQVHQWSVCVRVCCLWLFGAHLAGASTNLNNLLTCLFNFLSSAEAFLLG